MWYIYVVLSRILNLRTLMFSLETTVKMAETPNYKNSCFDKLVNPNNGVEHNRVVPSTMIACLIKCMRHRYRFTLTMLTFTWMRPSLTWIVFVGKYVVINFVG